MCKPSVAWLEPADNLLIEKINTGKPITSLEFKTELRERVSGEPVYQQDVGVYLRECFRNGEFHDYKSRSEGAYLTYYLPLLSRLKRWFRSKHEQPTKKEREAQAAC
jgi:hypothetical protein